MGIVPLALRKNYWQEFEIVDQDLEFLYNYLLEKETPLTPEELVYILVKERIQRETAALEQQQAAAGGIYLPKDNYQVGQALQFPQLDMNRGTVSNVRAGANPDMAPFEVITVAMEAGGERQFAAGLSAHKLNDTPVSPAEDPNLNFNHVIGQHGRQLTSTLTAHLEANPDLVRIAGRWFPRALLVDINVGHLNLAEAVLEMAGGGPLTTQELIEQLDLPQNVNAKLNEFSLNLALQEDERFDEVGPAGKVLWFLKRLEPDPVQQPPLYLRYQPVSFDPGLVQPLLDQFEGQVVDELEACGEQDEEAEQATVALLYPHFRAGTLPVCDGFNSIFPTAYESPRVQFTFVDGDTGENFNGWVVRQHKYVYGLREWYEKNGLIPGSLVTIQQSQTPGEVIIRSGKKRPTRDWVRTALVGSDGVLVFQLLKHNLGTTYTERMAIVTPDPDAIDSIWEQTGRQRGPLTQTVRNMMSELAKLSPQGHIHAQELYAAVNVVRRCPPGPILKILLEEKWAVHLGDLYFRLDESGTDGE